MAQIEGFRVQNDAVLLRWTASGAQRRPLGSCAKQIRMGEADWQKDEHIGQSLAQFPTIPKWE